MHSPIYVFRRFVKIKSNPLREISDRKHGLVIIPTEDIIFVGFSMHKTSGGSSYKFSYQVMTDGEVRSEGEATAGEGKDWHDEYYSRCKLPREIRVKAKTKIYLKCEIKTNSGRRSRFTFYCGVGGNKYSKQENDNMGIFEFEDYTTLENRARTGVKYSEFHQIIIFRI